VDDGSIGEVSSAVRVWRDGSMPAAYDGQRIAGNLADFSGGCGASPDLVWLADDSMPILCASTAVIPCLHSLSTELPGYNTVEFRLGTGAWVSGTGLGGDLWTATLGGLPVQTQLTPRSPSGCQDLYYGANPSTPSNYTAGMPIGIDGSTHTYHYSTTAAYSWPGGDVYVRISTVFVGEPCLDSVYVNYNDVVVYYFVSVPWAMTQDAHEAYHTDQVISGQTWRIKTSCGTQAPGLQDLTIQGPSPSTASHTYQAYSLSPAYPATWSYNTDTNSPPGWTGTNIRVQTLTHPLYRQHKYVSGSNAASLTATLTSPTIDGNALIAVYFQNGTSDSGGTLIDPAAPAGFARTHTTTNHRTTTFERYNAPATSNFTLTGIAAADQQALWLVELWCPVTGARLTDLLKQDQAGASALVSGSITTGSTEALFLHFAQQHLNNTPGGPPGAFSSASSGWTLEAYAAEPLAGPGPPFENMLTGFAIRSAPSGGSFSNTITSTVTRVWDSWVLAIG